MRGKKAAAAGFHPMASHLSRLVGNACTDCVGIALAPRQLDSQPVILRSGIVLQQQRSCVVYGDEHINSAIVVEVPDRQTARSKFLRECRSSPVANILEGTPLVLKQK